MATTLVATKGSDGVFAVAGLGVPPMTASSIAAAAGSHPAASMASVGSTVKISAKPRQGRRQKRAQAAKL